MKLLIFLTITTLVPASAQVASVKQAAPVAGVVVSEKSPVALQTIGAMEKDMDGRLAGTGAANNDACIVLSGTRGIYVNGFGAVFTADLDLVNTPSVGLFNTSISPQQKVDVHKRKLAHLSMLQQTMRDMVLAAAGSPALKLADTDQIVVSVRLMYRPWEDTTGLPGQIVMRLDHKGGTVKMEVQ